MRMPDKIALVTGAGSGLGRATAQRFGLEGARLLCLDTNVAGNQETVEHIRARGGHALAVAGSVTDPQDCARAVETALKEFGRLTTLVNCAGVRPPEPGPMPAPQAWQHVVDVNLSGSFYMSQAALPALKAHGASAITHLASIYGLVGGSTGVAYAASKGGIVNLTRQMALEWAPHVRVNCVCPGVIETPMTAPLRQDPRWAQSVLQRYPLGRFGQPEEVAAAILYLSSDEAAFVTGVALPVDGGYTAA